MTLADDTANLTTQASIWLTTHAPDILLGLLFAALLFAAQLAIRALGTRLCRESTTRWRAIAGTTLARTSTLFMAALAAKLVASYWGTPPAAARIVQLFFVIALAIQAAIWLREIILGLVDARAGDRPGETTVGNALRIIRLLVNVTLFAVALVLILSNLGVDVTGIVAGLGIGGIAIGLAARDVFSDLFAALAIIFDRPFRLGQTVKFGDTVGTVEAIGLKTTRVRSVDGDEVIIANAKLLDQQIRNLADVHDRRVQLTLPLLNRNDPAALERLPAGLQSIVEGEPDCRFVHACLTGFGSVTVELELLFRVETRDVDVMMQTRHRIVLAILAELRASAMQLNGPWPLPTD